MLGLVHYITYLVSILKNENKIKRGEQGRYVCGVMSQKSVYEFCPSFFGSVNFNNFKALRNLPPSSTLIILFELDFDVTFPLLRRLQFLSDLKSYIFCPY